MLSHQGADNVAMDCEGARAKRPSLVFVWPHGAGMPRVSSKLTTASLTHASVELVRARRQRPTHKKKNNKQPPGPPHELS